MERPNTTTTSTARRSDRDLHRYKLLDCDNEPTRFPERRARAWAAAISAFPELFEAGRLRHAERQNIAWSLTDCISFIVMERRGIHQALTHDHHFEQAGFEALLRRDLP